MKRACIGFLILMLTLPFPSYCLGEEWEEMEAASLGYDFGPISRFVGPESGRPEFGKDVSDNIGINKILIEDEGTRGTYETSSATSSESESSSSKDSGAVLANPRKVGGSITPSP